MADFYQLQANKINGESVSMQDFAGKVVLVVNTASKCGLTPQYQGLQELYAKHKDEGLVILGFPCNQFGEQEPGQNSDIAEMCLLNYGVDFPMFEKIDVNGSNAHEIFVYLKRALPGLLGTKIKWNFTKFLINRNGRPIKRYAPTKRPESIEADILKALKG